MCTWERASERESEWVSVWVSGCVSWMKTRHRSRCVVDPVDVADPARPVYAPFTRSYRHRGEATRSSCSACEISSRDTIRSAWRFRLTALLPSAARRYTLPPLHTMTRIEVLRVAKFSIRITCIITIRKALYDLIAGVRWKFEAKSTILFFFCFATDRSHYVIVSPTSWLAGIWYHGNF